MQTINKNSEKLAGVVDLYAIPTTNIIKILNKDIFCLNQDEIYHFLCATESIVHSSSSEIKDAGQLFTNKVSAFIPGQHNSIDKTLTKLARYKFVVVVRNQDDTYIMIGDKEIGLNFKWNYSNSSNWSASVGYELSFLGENTFSQKLVNFPFS
ncbi:MAG: hypothetical protein NTZ33_06195 [Bacteroidetes bacterium]|nr:hypothetical protein [Bacteroidota bacterium]